MTTCRLSITTGMSPKTDNMEQIPFIPGSGGPSPAGGRPLHIPLPMPERRAHTAIGFDLPDSEIFGDGEDDFDLEIPEDDDFDL